VTPADPIPDSRPSPRRLRTLAVAILLAAALVRLTALGSNPAGVFRDEAEKGYSAWSLIEVGGVFDFTGRGGPRLQRWPAFINVWGARTSMTYQYAAVPFVAVGGPNAWTARLPAALIATLTVWLTFLLARALTSDDRVALCAMAFLAFSPWHVVFSRWAQQGIFVPFFLTAALLVCVRARDARRPWVPLAAAAALFGLAFYTYSGARPFLLAFAVTLAVVFRSFNLTSPVTCGIICTSLPR